MVAVVLPTSPKELARKPSPNRPILLTLSGCSVRQPGSLFDLDALEAQYTGTKHETGILTHFLLASLKFSHTWNNYPPSE